MNNPGGTPSPEDHIDEALAHMDSALAEPANSRSREKNITEANKAFEKGVKAAVDEVAIADARAKKELRDLQAEVEAKEQLAALKKNQQQNSPAK